MDMSLGFVFLFTLIPAILLQGFLWIHAMKTNNAGWVDLGWTLGTAIGSIVLFFVLPLQARAVAVLLLVLFWSLRLASHIYFDRLKGNPVEDGRYTALRAHWGDKANAKFLAFFEGQAFLSALFLIPAVIVARREGAFPDVWDVLGLVIALGAIAGESLADRQLAAFRRNPENKGKVCKTGLWKYSRHPNYFFEWLHWMAYPVWAIGATGYPAVLLGPVLMFIFLRWVTGIPHTERQSLKSRGDAYRQYQQTTNMFFPWIPRNPS
jgi:steroid 5-alpha reductase family enzyme